MFATRALLAAALLASLAACGPFPTREAYYGQLQTWVGQHSDTLVRAWGPPDKNYKMADGTLLLEYDRRSERYVPGSSYPDRQPVYHRDKDGRVYRDSVTVWRQEPGRVVTSRCATRFTVAPSGLIQQCQFEGNDCVALPPPVAG